MDNATFVYLLTANGWTSESAEVTWNHSSIHKVRIEKVAVPDESQHPVLWLHASIFLTGVTDYDSAKAIANEAIQQIVAVISYVTEDTVTITQDATKGPSHVFYIQEGCLNGQRKEGHGKSISIYKPAIFRRPKPRGCYEPL